MLTTYSLFLVVLLVLALKASPVFYEQSKKLERARMEDFLKHKIQRRPDRHQLIQQHILEDTTVSPGLQDKQRLLKKARLADDLNDRLSHRPGPLELVKGNILLADERLALAIKEGQIQFKATCEGEAVKHPPPLFEIVEKDESSSESTHSPPPQAVPSPTEQSLSLASFSPGIATTSASDVSSIHSALHSPATSLPSPVPSLQSVQSVVSLHSPLSSLVPSPFTIQTQHLVGGLCTVSSQSKVPTANTATFVTVAPASLTAANIVTVSALDQVQPTTTVTQIKPAFTLGTTAGSPRSESSFSKSSRKKSKSKVQPKTRTIKFHEYKVCYSAI